ncbi:TVP38/TMEM64 family protein [Salipaludibacillus sp. CF4.18]|uniref:TVP38/TMEM64 family protein n=1 Tax=Salipaludibacillus sp. CF4.18 TaxID=3373081 RepID=UPI003EE6792A
MVTNRKKYSYILAYGMLLLLALYALSPGFRNFIFQAITQLSHGDIETVKNYLLTFGVWAPVISALLMVLSVLIAPLPAFIPTFANGLLFGAFWGGILSWSSALIDATLCFYIARTLGRPVVKKLVNRKALEWSDRFFVRYGYGMYAIIISRVVPIMSYGIISYAAGFTKMKFKVYIIGTAIGQSPATMLYSYLGEHSTESVMMIVWAFVAVVVIAIAGTVLKPWLERKMRKK